MQIQSTRLQVDYGTVHAVLRRCTHADDTGRGLRGPAGACGDDWRSSNLGAAGTAVVGGALVAAGAAGAAQAAPTSRSVSNRPANSPMDPKDHLRLRCVNRPSIVSSLSFAPTAAPAVYRRPAAMS